MSKGRREDLIYAYSRKQALADGVLVDVSEMATEAGFKYRTAVTRSVWCRYVEVPKACPWQDEKGRLWDILWMLHVAIKKGAEQAPLIFPVMIQNEPGPAKEVQLKAICGPGDIGEPVLTVMRPSED